MGVIQLRRLHFGWGVLAAASLLSACANQPSGGSSAAPASPPAAAAPAAPAAAKPPAPAAPTASASVPANPPGMRIVKSRDGRFEGEMVGTPAPDSKFAKVQIGMEMNEVLALMGPPVRTWRHETGKRWIPFYYGNDVTRIQAVYTGEGCLSFTGGNRFGAGGNELIRITVDPSLALCQS